MGHYKYASDEEAKEAIRRQKKEYVQRIGIENYRAMVRPMALNCYYRNKEKNKNEPKPEPKKRGRPRIKPIKEPKEPKEPKQPTIYTYVKAPKKSKLYEKIRQLEEIINNSLK